MSKLKRVAAEVTAITEAADALRAEAGSAPTSDHAALRALSERADELQRRVNVACEEMEGLAQRAREPDPDKRVYGPKTAERILELHATLTACAEALPDVMDTVRRMCAPLAGTEEAASGAANADAAELAARAEAESRARAEAAQRAAQEEAEHRAKAEAARLEAERQRAAEIAERNAALEREAARRKQEREREEQAERERQERLAAAESRRAEDAIDLLQSKCTRAEFVRASRALCALMGNIAREPSDPKFRHLRKANEMLQRDVTGVEGGEECLYSLGFRERRLTLPTAELYYVMQEPSTEAVEEWVAWFEGVQATAELLEGRLRSMGER